MVLIYTKQDRLLCTRPPSNSVFLPGTWPIHLVPRICFASSEAKDANRRRRITSIRMHKHPAPPAVLSFLSERSFSCGQLLDPCSALVCRRHTGMRFLAPVFPANLLPVPDARSDRAVRRSNAQGAVAIEQSRSKATLRPEVDRWYV